MLLKGGRPITTSPEIRELSAQYKLARRELPTADAAEVVDRIMPRLSAEHVLALAAEWLGMGGPPGLDTRATARGFVRNFVLAMDEPDDGF
ncbi:hypothetical protein BKA01_000414 [Pseudonocardia eucalypti]|nr:hypothetical protein [Pseudonocardia eucalypti]